MLLICFLLFEWRVSTNTQVRFPFIPDFCHNYVWICVCMCVVLCVYVCVCVYVCCEYMYARMHIVCVCFLRKKRISGKNIAPNRKRGCARPPGWHHNMRSVHTTCDMHLTPRVEQKLWQKLQVQPLEEQIHTGTRKTYTHTCTRAQTHTRTHTYTRTNKHTHTHKHTHKNTQTCTPAPPTPTVLHL